MAVKYFSHSIFVKNTKAKSPCKAKKTSEKLFNSFQLSERVPKENFYRRLRERLDLKFLHPGTVHLYGDTGNLSIDPVVFFLEFDKL